MFVCEKHAPIHKEAFEINTRQQKTEEPLSQLTKYNILSGAKCGIEFEFYTEKNSSTVTKELGKMLNKKIVIPDNHGAIGKEEKGTYHSSLEPTATVFKLEKDYSGGKDMRELITGPMSYEEARIVIIKVLDWIRENGWTDKKCAIHLNISFNPFLLKLKNNIGHLDTLKFILNFDENFIYERFPERKNSVYARSINQIIPLNKFTFLNTQDGIDPTNYEVPDEKYYGINFTKKPKNYLEVRYLGGKGYEFKTSKILEVLDYTILKIYEALQNPQYTSADVAKLKKMMVDQRQMADAFVSIESFFLKFPKINIFVDMRGQKEVLKSYWTTIRESLFSVVVSGGMREGIYNYDTDVAISQLRYVKLKNAHDIENFEMFDCELEGSFSNTVFFRCKIRDSRLNQCKLIELNEVEDSKVEHTTSYPSTTLLNCYINSQEQVIEGVVEGGVIRNAIIGERAEISARTLRVEETTPEKKKMSFYKHDDKK